ncbi:MAG: sensor histidine kinase [Halanaerobiaceae bacterium]
MSNNNKKTPKLEEILEKTIEVLETSKKDMFSIYESSRNELENINNEIKLINQEIEELINKIHNLEKKNRKARIRLMEVSRDLNRYDESDIKKAYKEAEDTSVDIAVLKEKEEQLKNRRKELENRIINVRNTVKKAESLISKMGVVGDYLKGELSNLSDHIDDIRQKQKVAMRVIEAQEEERKRVAREIHDGPAQSLANLVFRCEFTQKIIDKDVQQAKDELKSLKNIVRSSVQDVRKIIYDLRPMSLDDLGLIPTLKRYIDKFIKQTEININFEIRGEQKSLPSSYEITIFRLVQEGLNNIYKHAQADRGRVCLEFAENQVNILIVDQGQGFDIDEVNNDKFGLISMRERCDLVGGEMKINSKKNKGTRIQISIPFMKGE